MLIHLFTISKDFCLFVCLLGHFKLSLLTLHLPFMLSCVLFSPFLPSFVHFFLCSLLSFLITSIELSGRANGQPMFIPFYFTHFHLISTSFFLTVFTSTPLFSYWFHRFYRVIHLFF